MRGNAATITLALCSLVLDAPPGASQNVRTAHEHEAEATIAGYADCVVARKSKQAAVDTFLRTVPNTEGSYRAGVKAADMTCLDKQARMTQSVITMRMNPAMLRQALYPALYRRDFKGAAPSWSLATLPPRELKAEFDGDVAALPAEYLVTRTLGDCMSRAAPDAARALLLATPWTRADDVAVEQLKPTIASCLPQGQTVRFNRAALRAYVGEAMYKLARAQAT